MRHNPFMDVRDALNFVRDNHRVVLATRRANGDPQLSPLVCAVDDDGKVVISTRETAIKVKNVRRDPRVALCVINDGFFGRWVQLDGTAEIVSLPDAMEGLVDYYRRISGEHPDWDDYRTAMQRERRCLLRVTVTRAGPDVSG
jgi:PPOX class probable F420-dependent enzyme